MIQRIVYPTSWALILMDRLYEKLISAQNIRYIFLLYSLVCYLVLASSYPLPHTNLRFKYKYYDT